MIKISNYKVLSPILWFLVTSNCVLGIRMSVWRTASYTSDRTDVDIDSCANLPRNVSGQVKAIDAYAKCSRLYSDWNCTGDAIEILPASPSHHNLGVWGWNDRAFSVGPCLDLCDESITGGNPSEPFSISVFSRPGYKGAYTELVVNGCTRVPPQFVYQFHSVVRNGHCVQLWDNTECEPSWRTIELRNGTPKHDDIVTWWYFKRTKAVSHCSFKCNRMRDERMDKANSDVEPGIGQITLFDDANFNGHWITLDVANGCVDLAGTWDGTAMSVKANPGKCATLFDRRNCSGKAFNFISNESNLAERNFGEITRSVKHCDWKDDTEQFVLAGGQVVLSPGWIGGLVIVAVVVVGAFVTVVVRLARKLKMARRLSEREIREFLKGFASDAVGKMGSDSGGHYENSGFSEENDDMEVVAIQAAYDMRYEVKREWFSLSEGTLGMGEFGIVYKGTLSIEGRDNEQITVAVKTLKSNSDVDHLRSLMKEVKVMMYISELGHHTNIVSVVGCCTEKLRDGDLYMLMEYCCNGSLKSFLCKNRDNFTSIVTNGMVDSLMSTETRNQSMLCDQVYEDGTTREELKFNLFQQLRWISEIASGMEFLAAAKIVHRDLAARNVLIDAQFGAKISDFGLSRKMYNYASYLKKGDEAVPWKWLALESILNATYTSKSDVWSFGVVCWEIFSLGAEPFVGDDWGEEFVYKLEQGYRLGRPTDCVVEIYELMINCWHNDSSQRPSFLEITRNLKHMPKMPINSAPEEMQLPSGYVESIVVEA